MSVNAAQLLKILGAGVIPGGVKPGACECDPALDFAKFLEKAKSGAVTSGKALHAPDPVAVDLSPEQLSRLNQAADAAEVAGAQKLFVVIDGVGVVIDVPSRTIEKSVELTNVEGERVLPADVLFGVDSVAVVPSAVDEPISIEPAAATASRRARTLPPISHIENQSLLSRLALSDAP